MRKGSRRRGAARRDERAVYIISVAAELAGVHPQTLRIYERKGLLSPARTPGNTRRYSERDLERLRAIQRLTQDRGVNLAGVRMIVELEDEVDRLRGEAERLAAELERSRGGVRRAFDHLERSSGGAILPAAAARRIRLLVDARSARRSAGSRGPIPLGPTIPPS
jgi:MerR family transcriptional regulator, heat shock protein HspR